MKSAVLLIIYRRYETAATVMSILREVKPSKLFIAADGPRNEQDIEKCKKAREVIDLVDWECEVSQLFRQDNLGCGKGPAEAIDWFFSKVEEGIILEDDCYPDSSFFRFCDEMLERYRDDHRVMHIGGTNHHRGQKYGSTSYFFSRINACWGWATWRQAWRHFDYRTPTFESFRNEGKIFELFPNREMAQFIIDKFESAYRNDYQDIWDYQWQFAFLANAGLAVMSNFNLIKNIGFGEDAIHTVLPNKQYDEIVLESMTFPLEHPESVEVNHLADYNTYLNWYKPRKQSLILRSINKVKRALVPLKKIMVGMRHENL